MIIGAYVRRAAPDHCAGAEWAMHDTLAWLRNRGHACVIVSEQGVIRGLVDDIHVHSQPTEDDAAQHFVNCDVMLTQLEGVPQAQVLASAYQTPLVQLVHSANQPERLGMLPGCSALLVFNTHHAAAACSWWPGESMVLHPPIREQRVRTDASTGQCATLVNLSHEKGAMTLVRLAELLPRRWFMGVSGAYGEQAITPAGVPGHGDNPLPSPLPPNLGVSGVVRDMRPIYASTRVQLMLSRTETYGRVAAEAMLSGIPVIARDTPGLREACDNAAEYVDESDEMRSLASLVERAHSDAFEEWSAAALRQAAENQRRSERELETLESALIGAAERRPVMAMSTEATR